MAGGLTLEEPDRHLERATVVRAAAQLERPDVLDQVEDAVAVAVGARAQCRRKRRVGRERDQADLDRATPAGIDQALGQLLQPRDHGVEAGVGETVTIQVAKLEPADEIRSHAARYVDHQGDVVGRGRNAWWARSARTDRPDRDRRSRARSGSA